MDSSGNRFFAMIEHDVLQVANPDVRDAVLRAYHRSMPALAKVESLFDLLTTRRFTPEGMFRFFQSWRHPLRGASSIAGLSCRLSAAATAVDGDRRAAFFMATAGCAEIIAEDMGVPGIRHDDMFYRLATAICGSDEWQSKVHTVEPIIDFHAWVNYLRRHHKDLLEGVLTTIASEIYNHGEFCMIAPMFERWMTEELGMPRKDVRPNLAFILVHTGSTESDHFMKAIDVFDHYNVAAGLAPSYDRLEARCVEYLTRIGDAYEILEADIARFAIARGSVAQFLPSGGVDTRS